MATKNAVGEVLEVYIYMHIINIIYIYMHIINIIYIYNIYIYAYIYI